jgi:hypothetical protein
MMRSVLSVRPDRRIPTDEQDFLYSILEKTNRYSLDAVTDLRSTVQLSRSPGGDHGLRQIDDRIVV